MASNIVLKTFAAGDDGQGTVTPQDDALIYQNAIPMNGIFSGATVTLSEANVLHIAAGFGIIGGRFFEINESDVTVELSSSGTLLGRLYIHLELTNADVPIIINVATGASLPALVGDPDLNINDGAFDLELATFNVSEVTISDIVNTFPTISKANNQLRRATAYSVNDMVLCQSASNALIFICTTAGTTAIQEPTAYQTVTDGNTVTDGTAVFKAVSVSEQITKLSKTEDLISIVENGNTCTHTGGISKGQYVNWKGDLYTADSNISVGATFASSGGSKNLTAVVDGGLNDLKSWGTGQSITTTYGNFVFTKRNDGIVHVSFALNTFPTTQIVINDAIPLDCRPTKQTMITASTYSNDAPRIAQMNIDGSIVIRPASSGTGLVINSIYAI